MLGKSLIGILNHFHGRAHLVCVISHIGDCQICLFGRRISITVKALQQGRGEAGDGFHILVCGHTSCFISVCGILLHHICRLLKQRFNAAYKLFVLCVLLNCLFTDSYNSSSGSGHSSGSNFCGCNKTTF